MQLIDLKLGSEGEIKADLVAGVVVMTIDEKTAGLSGGLQLKIPLAYFLDALVAKANNPIVTGVVKVMEGVLISMP